MTGFELKKFEISDYMTIVKTHVENDLKAQSSAEQWARYLFINGHHWTVWREDLIIVCGGVRNVWTVLDPGAHQTGMAWFEANMNAGRFTRAKALHLYAKTILRRALELGDYTCLLADARPEYGGGALLTRLGFARIGRIPKYFPNDADMVLYMKEIP